MQTKEGGQMHRGYVLHTRPYRESSVLVNLLVDGLGRIDAVARLGRGKASIKSILQPFQPLLFQLSGRGSLKSLYQVEAASPAIPVSGNVSFAALYLNELTMRCLLPELGCESFFVIYHRTLMHIASEFSEAPLRYFELDLLRELGLMPSLSADIAGCPITSAAHYRLVPQEGFSLSAVPSGEHFCGAMLLALRDKRLQAADFKQAKDLMRRLLLPLLGERPLKSRALFVNRNKLSGGS